MTPVKSFICRKDASGIRGECIEMRNRGAVGSQGVTVPFDPARTDLRMNRPRAAGAIHKIKNARQLTRD